MRAGQLRHTITIQQRDKTVVRGAQSSTWNDVYAGVAASVQPLRGREVLISRQEHADLTHRVMLRYLDGITPKMRVVYGARILEIQSAINAGERNAELELLCVEVLNA